MDKSLSLGVVIGATVAGSLSRSVGLAKSQFSTLGDSIKELSGQRDLIERFEKDQATVETTRLRLEKARKEVLQVKLALRKDPDNAGLARDLRRAERQSSRLGEVLDRQRGKLRQSQRSMERAGVGVRDHATEYARLGREIEKTQAKHARLNKYMARRDAAGQRLGDMRGQMLGGVGALYGVGRMVGEAADFGRAVTRLSTVANAENVGKAVAESRRHALAYARKSLATETEILDIEYALNSAGLDASTARIASELVSRVAKVTGGASEQVGEVVATTFNNLGSQLEGSAARRLERIGDLLTKTQFKFQIRDFGQLGESMKMATPALSQYNVNLEQGVTLIGALNSAGLQGSMAGTALAATFRNMSKASEKFGFSLVRDAEGGLDFIATLRNLSDAIGGFEGMDQQTIDDLQSVFGEEGIRMVSLLGPKLRDLADAQRDVARSSKGIVDESYQRYLEDSRGQLTQLGNNVRTLGLAFAGTLLPSVNALLKPVATLAARAGEMVEKFPIIGKVLAGAVAGFVAIKGAMMLATAAQWAWNAAFVANPIGAVVAGIGVAAALVVHYWDPIADFFKELWDRITSVFKAGVGVVKKIWAASPIGQLFKAGKKLAGFVGDLWGGGKKAAAGAAVGTALATNVAASSPPALAASHTSSTTITAPITVHATPGMDERQVAEEVARALDDRERQARARHRGRMYD